jgi:WD40 repeat protein
MIVESRVVRYARFIVKSIACSACTWCFSGAPAADVGSSASALDSALNTAVQQGNVKSVEILLQAGASPDAKVGRTNEEVFCSAVQATGPNAIKIVQLLLKFKAKTEVRCSFDTTPLGNATAAGNQEMVKLLLAAGASTGSLDSIGQTPGETAHQMGNAALAQSLGAQKATPICRVRSKRPESSDKNTPVLESLVAPGAPITAAAFDDEGRFLVLGGNDGTLSLWEIASGRKVRSFTANRGSVNSVMLDSKRQLLLRSSQADGTATILGLLDNQPTLEIHNLDAPVWIKTPAVLIGAYETIVALAAPRLLIAWRVSDCQEIARVTVDDDLVTISSSAAAGWSVAIAEQNGAVQIWNPYLKQLTPLIGPGRRANAMTVSPDGKLLAIATAESQTDSDTRLIDIWQFGTPSVRVTERQWTSTSETEDLAFSSDGSALIAIDSVEARVFRVPDGVLINTRPLSSTPVSATAFAKRRCFLIVGYGSDIIAAESGDAANNACRQKLAGISLRDAEPHLSAVEHALIVRSGNQLINWNLDKGSAQGVWPALGTSQTKDEDITAVTLSDHLPLLFVGTTAGRIVAADFHSGAAQIAAKIYNCPVDALALVRDGLLTASGDRIEGGCKDAPSIRLLRASDLTLLGRPVILPDKTPITHILGDPSRALAYTIGFDRTIVRVWDLSTGMESKSFPDLKLIGLSGSSIVVLPDGRGAVGFDGISEDGKGIALLDPSGATPPALLATPMNSSILDIEVDEKRRRILAGGSSGQLYAWSIDTRKLLSATNDAGAISSLVLSEDGRTLFTGLKNGLVTVWDQDSLTVRAHLLAYYDTDEAHAVHWLVTTPDGRYDSNSPGDVSGVSWVLPSDPLIPLPIEAFFRDYYMPGLLGKVLQGEKMPVVQLLETLNRVPPEVRIKEITADDADRDRLAVTVSVSDGSKEIHPSSGPPLTMRSGAYDLRLFRNGQLVGQYPDVAPTVESSPVDVNGRLGREAWRKLHEITLPNGNHTYTFRGIRVPRRQRLNTLQFTAYAFNSDRVKSQTALSEYSLRATSSFSTPSHVPRAYLITIGVNANQSHNLNLDLAVSSAEKVRALMRDKFSPDYSEVVEIPLYSDFLADSNQVKSKAASKTNLRAALDLLAGRPVSPSLRDEVDPKHQLREAEPDDSIVLYVASHGYADPQGAFYLMPYDTGPNWGITEDELTRCLTKPDSTPPCKQAKDFLAHSVSSADLALWWSGIDAGEMVMILDSCHSGAVPGRQFRPGPLGDPGFGQLSYDKGMQILSASQPTQTVQGEWVTGGEGRTLLVDALETVAREYPEHSFGQWLHDTEEQLPITAKELYPTLKEHDIQLPLLLDFGKVTNSNTNASQ